jgi:hypothetical protein
MRKMHVPAYCPVVAGVHLTVKSVVVRDWKKAIVMSDESMLIDDDESVDMLALEVAIVMLLVVIVAVVITMPAIDEEVAIDDVSVYVCFGLFRSFFLIFFLFLFSFSFLSCSA